MNAGRLPFVDAADWRPEAPPDLARFDVIDLDCESTGLDRFDDRPVGLAIGFGGRTQYLPVGHRAGGNLDEDTVKRWAQRELRGKRIRNAHLKPDLHWLENWGVNLREQDNTFHDVAHSEALLDDHESDFTLEHLATKRLGRGKLPMDGAGIADRHAGDVAAYACEDVALVRDLVDVYTPLVAAEDLTEVAALEDRIIPVCIEMERNGLPLDEARLARWEAESKALLESMLWDLYRQVGFMVNPKAADDMRRLFAHVNEPVPVTQKKVKHLGGRFTYQPAESFEGDLVRPVGDRHPEVLLAYQISKLMDLRSKSLVKYQGMARNGRLFPAFHQLKFDRNGGAVSGRFSSSGPNGQNIMGEDAYTDDYAWWLDARVSEPMRVRQLFVGGGPTRRLLVADQKQVELRIAAHFARAQKIIEAYRSDPNVDFHQVVYGMIAPYRPGTTRTQTKITGFRRLYGSGEASIARSLKLSAQEGHELVRAYDAMFPEWKAFLDRASEVAKTRGFVKTILKRRARFGPHDRFYAAANRICQGTSADIMKLTLIDLYEQRHALGLTLRATVHDEVVTDETDLAPVEALLNVQRVPLDVPITWKAGVGASWAEAK